MFLITSKLYYIVYKTESYLSILNIIETVTAPELLESVYDQVNSLINAYGKQSKRERRDTKTSLTEMDCQLFVEMLNLFETLKNLTSSSKSIIENQKQIQETANSIQMFSIFDGISMESCKNIEPKILEATVKLAKNSLGK